MITAPRHEDRPAFALAGVGVGCAETAEHAAVAAFAPTAIRGSAFGLLATVQALGNVAASAIAGLLYAFASPAVAFLYLGRGCSSLWRCSLGLRARRPSMHLGRHSSRW